MPDSQFFMEVILSISLLLIAGIFGFLLGGGSAIGWLHETHHLIRKRKG